MTILGVSPNHDASLCVVRDGKILAAISRERFSRKKKDRFITQKMVNRVLKIAGIQIDDIESFKESLIQVARITSNNQFGYFIYIS